MKILLFVFLVILMPVYRVYAQEIVTPLFKIVDRFPLSFNKTNKISTEFISFTSEGDYFYLLNKKAEIHVFDKHGHFSKTISISMTSPQALYSGNDNTIWAYDFGNGTGNGKLINFNFSGALLDTFKLSGFLGGDVEFSSENIIYLAEYNFHKGNYPEIVKRLRSGKELLRIRALENRGTFIPGRMYSKLIELYDKGTLYICQTHSYQISVYSSGGATLYTFTNPSFIQRPYSQSELQRLPPIMMGLTTSDYPAAVDFFLLFGNRYLLTFLKKRPGDAEYAVDCFTRSGKYLTQFKLTTFDKLYDVCSDMHSVYLLCENNLTQEVQEWQME